MYPFKLRSKLLCFLLAFVLILSGCAKKAQQKPTSDEPKETPKVVDEIITDIYTIMVDLDLVPYYNNEIKEMKAVQKQQKEFLIKIGGGQTSDKETPPMEAKELIKYQQKPLEITDTVIFEVLNTDVIEIDKKKLMMVPKDISVTWTKINKQILDLNKKWNALESEVVKSHVTQEPIKAFEKVLNNLTISCSQNNQLDALFHCNRLMFYIPELIKNFKNIHPVGIYYMQYYLVQTVFEARINDYDKAMLNLDKLRTYNDYLKEQLVAKKATSLANKLESSVVDLGNSLPLKDMSIIKIKASIVMTNIVLSKDEFVK